VPKVSDDHLAARRSQILDGARRCFAEYGYEGATVGNHEFNYGLPFLNQITGSPAMKTLPADMQQTLRELNRSMKGLQPGSPAYNKLVGDMQRLDQVLRELQPVLKTLNAKSNALVFEAKPGQDPQPKRAKQ